jgi:hypothetical protein
METSMNFREDGQRSWAEKDLFPSRVRMGVSREVMGTEISLLTVPGDPNLWTAALPRSFPA